MRVGDLEVLQSNAGRSKPRREFDKVTVAVDIPLEHLMTVHCPARDGRFVFAVTPDICIGNLFRLLVHLVYIVYSNTVLAAVNVSIRRSLR